MHQAIEADSISANTRSPRTDQSTIPVASKTHTNANQMVTDNRPVSTDGLFEGEGSTRLFAGFTTRFRFMIKKTMERVKGIEPSYAAWEAAVLPLNYTRIAHGLALYRKAALTAQSIASNFRTGRDAPRDLSGRTNHEGHLCRCGS